MGFKHGRSGYTNHRCRCGICTTAANKYNQTRIKSDPKYHELQKEYVRKSHNKHIENGLCRLCNEPLFTPTHCIEHAWKQVNRGRKTRGTAEISFEDYKRKKCVENQPL